MKKIKKLSAEERVQFYDQLLYEIEDELKTIQELIKQFKKTQKKVEKLSEYFFSEEWMNDYDKFQESKGLHVISQDYPYDAITEFRALQLDLLKRLVKDL